MAIPAGWLAAGRAQDRHGAGRVRVGRGYEGVLTEEDSEVARAAAAVRAVAMRPALKATVVRVAGVGSRAGMGPGSWRTVSWRLAGRCAAVRMVATAGPSAACRCTASASQAGFLFAAPAEAWP